jgi:shikimate kinase
MIKIILLGYMGSGKSAVAKLLHQETGIQMLDLDQMVEKKAGLSIPELFATKGEIYFRKLEHKLFTEVLRRDTPFILSLGGGTPCYANNHLLLNGDDISAFYLKASPETLFTRLVNDRDHRPLLAGKDPAEMTEFIAKHLFDRSYYYNQAKYKVITDDKSPQEVALEILAVVQNAR